MRNIIVEGSLLSGVTPSQAAYFGYPASAAGGVHLSGDSLGIVAVRDQLPAGGITAATIQGVAFAGLVDFNGTLHSAASIQGATIAATNAGRQFLLTALAINPQTKKPYAKVVVPNQTLQAPVSTKSSIAIFAGWAGQQLLRPAQPAALG